MIPILPLLGAIFNGLVSNRLGLSKSVTNAVALLGSGLAWLLGWGAIVQWVLDLGIHHTHVVRLFSWIQGGSLRILDGSLADVDISASFQLDAVSALMVFFVTFVGFLIHVYSIGYMHDESGSGLRALLLLPQPLHVFDAGAGARLEPRGPLSSVGKAWASAPTC